MRLVSLLPGGGDGSLDTPTFVPNGGGLVVDYSSLTVARLRQELKRRGLSQKGLKRELIRRLQDSDLDMPAHVRGRRKAPNADQNGDIKKSGSSDGLTPHQKMIMHEERSSLVLWRKPLLTSYYFLLEGLTLFRELCAKLWRNKKLVFVLLLTFLIIFAIYHTDGPHQKYVWIFRKQFLWCTYWIGLGILSSVGLGTGLHTFVLYLGPHIAAVTLAAFECMSVDFPEPPYPNDIICPEEEGTSMSLWTIMSKVRLEACMWGIGTAIGELPPYFMAKAARLSGQVDEDEQDIEELIHGKDRHPTELSFLDRGKIIIHDTVQRVGFMGILLCASIPNPLFDLAGITCGHFLIPFWTFFGATVIGKAIIKMHIQKLFVIFLFSEKHVEHVIYLLKYLPYGESLQAPFKEYLEEQKAKLHHKPGTDVVSGQSWLSRVFEKLLIAMVVYYIISIINSMAKSYHKRMSKTWKPNKVSQE
ncbi:hypothetical protein LSH36_15g02111 [Paralvinella palmiformis]|uniref:SAP domain-containing protein n=1 Tax=Paralvinella palmiformis TaxID=53620 RepID=A0AAD9KBI1_9ANNE|nr:hypothetical protein LSH36_15g02111 [Paralvinella palmiformis]